MATLIYMEKIMATDFFNLYIEKLSSQIGELSKLMVLKETQIAFQQKSIDSQNIQIKELQEQVEKLEKSKKKKGQVEEMISAEEF